MKQAQITFKKKYLDKITVNQPTKIAVFITNEYEGFSRNGGIGTYYTSLSENFAKAGWENMMIYCQSEQKFQGDSNTPALKYVFSSSEVEDVLNLNENHLSLLAHFKSDFYFNYQSLANYFFCSAISLAFPDSKIYVEFPDVNGFAYHTIQAKKSNLLPPNCLISITIHGCFEWVYEANDSIINDQWFHESSYREQVSYENTDLAFFPSYFLRNTTESYGWQMSHAHNMRYFLPILPLQVVDTYKNQNIIPEIVNLPGMSSLEERNFVYEYAEKNYQGKGEIVDLGCWLGSFTVPLALGLNKNTSPEKQDKYIHAYDLFRWKEWMNNLVINTELEGKYKPEDSFLPDFEKIISPWQEKIKVYAGDLNTMDWEKDKPIEFLLIDAMKSWELCNKIVNQFFPALIPQVSWIQHQDFAHYHTSWIHLIMYRFKDYFEPILYVPNSSLIYRYLKKIPEEYLTKTYSFADFDDDEINRAFDYSLSIAPPSARANVAAAKVMLYIWLKDMSKARQELELFKKNGIYCHDSEFGIIEEKLRL